MRDASSEITCGAHESSSALVLQQSSGTSWASSPKAGRGQGVVIGGRSRGASGEGVEEGELDKDKNLQDLRLLECYLWGDYGGRVRASPHGRRWRWPRCLPEVATAAA